MFRESIWIVTYFLLLILFFFLAMMIECMAGKAASLHGQVHYSTPFEFSEKNTAIDYFGTLFILGLFFIFIYIYFKTLI